MTARRNDFEIVLPKKGNERAVKFFYEETWFDSRNG